MSSTRLINEATISSSDHPESLYREHVNPQWVRLLNLLRMNVRYTRCRGTQLQTDDGRMILDFLSGYCVHNTGHNHPSVIKALEDELRREGPAMVQSHVPDLAGQLASQLCARAGDKLSKVFFCSSGSEGVEAAMKFARAYTARDGFLYANGAFHGLTMGALSLMGDDFWREGFGPLLPNCTAVPFGDLAALKSELETRRYAALLLEPMQGEAGICIPSEDYLREVERLCRQHGTLLVLDEVQTGLGRTGRFLAGHHCGVQPDIVVLAKALSGGLVPVGAVLMTDGIYDAVYGSLKRSIIHTSTYSENALAMRAGLATLEVIERENLAARAQTMGSSLREKLKHRLGRYEMVREVRGEGLFCGIEFQAPRQLRLRASFEAFKAIHPGLFGQMVVMNLFQRDILTQMCGNNFMVLKAAPPLIVEEAELDTYVAAVAEVVELMHSSGSFWSDALGIARRAANILSPARLRHARILIANSSLSPLSRRKRRENRMRCMPLALAICLSLCSGTSVSAQSPSNDGLASNPLFEKNCAKCHGKTGDGRHFAGPSLKTEKVAGASAGDLRAIIANGKGHMPKFGDKLTSDEISTLAEQIKALK